MLASVAAAPPEPPGFYRRFLSIPNGPEIAYVEAGEGPPLMLVHGALMTLDDMRLGPMGALARYFRVIAFDRPGHGESGHVRLADASMWRQAEIIHEIARVLEMKRPVVVGHSFGGAVALAYGMAYPDDTAGVVAISPICFPELRLEQILFGPRAMPLLGDVLSASLRGADAAVLPLLWRAMFLPQAMPDQFEAKFPFALAGRADRLVADGENANMLPSDLSRSALLYGTCRVPVRILCGSADMVTNPLTHGYRASWMIPKAHLEWLTGLGHMLHHFRPDAVVEAARAVASHP